MRREPGGRRWQGREWLLFVSTAGASKRGWKGKTSSRQERECNKRPALLERKTHEKRETRRNSKSKKRVSAVES